MSLDSYNYLKLNDELIPTGEVIEAYNSPFNFIKERKLNDGIIGSSEQNKIVGNGYDHYFIFKKNKKRNIIVKEETSGRVLRVETTQPGVVLYTGQNIVEGLRLKEGTSKKYLGVCFETQASPASLHHEGLAKILLRPDEIYKKQIIFSFN